MNPSHRFAVIVNDDPAQLTMLSVLVRKAGLEPLAFTAADAALSDMTSRARTGDRNPGALPALIVTDLYMPGIDGWRFCRLLRSSEYAPLNQIPILVISSTYAGVEASRIATDLGVEAFLPSPVDVKQFVEQIHSILDGKRAVNPLRVLIVEDSKTLANTLKKTFTDNGYRADTALSARAAIDAFNKSAYDLAVLDYHLPDGSGDALLDEFRRQRPDCACLMMTTDPGPELALDWMKRGAAAYLQKPFQLDYLIEMCARARRERALLRVQELLEVRTRELRESEERHRTILQTAMEGFWLVDMQGRLLEVNETYCRMSGYSAQELLTMRVRDLEAAEADADTATHIHKVLAKGEDRFESQHRRKDGDIFDVEVSVQYRPTDGGRLVAFLRDITERKFAEEANKRAEEAKRESEEKHRILLDESSDPIFSFSPEGRYLYANHAFAEGTGKTLDQITGKTIWDVFSKEEADKRFAALNYVFQSGEEKIIEVRVPRLDGTFFYITTITPIKDIQGKVTTVICSSKNITARKQTEEALKNSLSLLLATLESTADGILVVDTNGKVVSSSQRFLDLWRIPETMMTMQDDEQLLRFVSNQLLHPDVFIDKVQALYKTPDASSIDELVFKDGRVFERYSQPQRIDDAIVGRVWSFRDITHRKQAEFQREAALEALRRSEERFSLAMEANSDGLWDWDVNTGEGYYSPRYAAMLGYASGEVPAQVSSWTDLIHTEDKAAALKANMDCVENCCDSFAVEFRMHAKNGEWRWILRRGKAVSRNVNGRAIRIVGTHTDITERKRAEEEKVKLESQLQQAQKMESVGRLAGGVAHDFNNMLGVILGYSEMAMNQVDSFHPLNRNLTQIRNAAERSAALTQQLLAFARKQTVSPKVLDLSETVAGMLKMLHRLIGEDIELTWKPGKELWPVKVDPSQIDQMLANLCVNARDAITDVGKISIETGNIVLDEDSCAAHPGFVAGEFVRLTVSDDGSGMDKETLEHLFEPFFTTKGLGKGTGLGLATVYGAVKQNNGFLDVRSEPGSGTTFAIYLPRHAGKPGHASMAVAAKPLIPGEETILLVEDEPAILEMATLMLEKQGYTVLAANSPGQAIHLAREHAGDIHLLMTDVVMPEMNGRDLAKNLLSIYPDLKRLFMSGYTADVIAHHSVLEEGVHFIQKPFKQETLAAKVREALTSK